MTSPHREPTPAGFSPPPFATGLPEPGRSALRRVYTSWLMLGAIALLVLCLAPLFGATSLNFSEVFLAPRDVESIDRRIFFEARLPRVLFGMIAGAALALAGSVYQGILRNDLAEPYTLGVAAGASFGALLIYHIAPPATVYLLMPLAAFSTAFVAISAIYTLAYFKGSAPSPATLILAGVTLNFFFGALILLIQYVSDPYQTMMMIRWLMGGLDVSSYRLVVVAAGVLLAAAVVLLPHGRALNLLSVGDTTAHNLGVSVHRVRILMLGTSSALAAFVVAFCGPIGFVGLMVPHMMRRLTGADHRALLPATLLAGGSFLVLCDTGARTLMAPTEIPVGIVTAFLGAPFFLWLLFRRTG